MASAGGARRGRAPCDVVWFLSGRLKHVKDAEELGSRLVAEFAQSDVPLLLDGSTVEEALASIRQHGLGERIVYFYVVDAERRLVGVVPTRRLLTAALDSPLRDVMGRRTIALPADATVLDACELFATHRYLALPVVDGENRVLGVVDVSVFTDEVFDLAERQEVEDLFETIGFRVSDVRRASPLAAFRLRFPWLLATISGGTACALIAGLFQATLAGSIVLAFFLTLVLGLAESVCVQTLTVAVQALHRDRPSLARYAGALRRELATAFLLAVSCGAIVGSVVSLWRGNVWEALAIGGSIFLTLVVAAGLGLTVPFAIHARRLDPRLSAGPIALALTDVTTITVYLSVGTWLLG